MAGHGIRIGWRPLFFLILLVVAFVLFGVGLTLHLLWWTAVVIGVVSIFGFVTGRRRRRD